MEKPESLQDIQVTLKKLQLICHTLDPNDINTLNEECRVLLKEFNLLEKIDDPFKVTKELLVLLDTFEQKEKNWNKQ